MASVERMQANMDLVNKLKLERGFIIRLRKLFRSMIDEFAAGYAADGDIIQAQDFEPEFRALILEQYRRTSKVFKRGMRNRVGMKSMQVKSVGDDIDRNIRLFSHEQSTLSAKAISRTNQLKIEDAIKKSIASLMFDAVVDDQMIGAVISAPTSIAIAKEARRLLNIETTNRSNVIALTETQKIAERSKQIEIDVLKTDQEFIEATGGAEIIKDWVNVGDDKVRDTHVQAQFDNKNIPANDPFIVGGFQLMIPGDSSLGAPLDEIINCRCSSVYNVKGL